MDLSQIVPSLTEQSETEIRSRLITLLQTHVAPGYAVGGRWRRLEDIALQKRDAMMKAAGYAEALLIVLETRGIPVSETQRQEILGCQDLDRLSRWLRRAVLASSAGEVTSEP
jgi:hypothetical protein